MTSLPDLTLSDLTLAGFIEAVGQDHPSPGCGGAGAVALALAAACARKAFVISARRRGGALELRAAAERCGVLSETAVAGVQRDATDFEAYLKAPRGADGPAQALTRDGQALMAVASELRALLARYAAEVDAHLAGDAAAALALAEAFERIETRNLMEI